jgi:hypothetical protein
MRMLVDWVGTGRALTQTSRLRRADALALVDLLDTDDVLDRRFPIQSSTELYHLNPQSIGDPTTKVRERQDR